MFETGQDYNKHKNQWFLTKIYVIKVSLTSFNFFTLSESLNRRDLLNVRSRQFTRWGATYGAATPQCYFL